MALVTVATAVLPTSGCAEATSGPSAIRPLTVAVTDSLPVPPPPMAGLIDRQGSAGAELTISGWAELSDTEQVSITVVTDRPVTVVSAYRVVREDVTVAVNDRRLVWSGFSITLRGTSPDKPKHVCLISSDPLFGSHTVGRSPIESCAR